MDQDVTALVDEAWALKVEVDDATPMWESQIEQIERWVSTSSTHTAEVAERCEDLRDRLRDRAEQEPGVDEAASLLTAAAMLEKIAATVDVNAELTLPDPEQGLPAFLHWAVPNYPLVTPEHGERYVDKLHRLPTAIDELRARLAEAAAAGRAPLARHARGAVRKLDADLAAPVADDPLLTQDPPSELADDQVAAWRDRVADAIRDATRPALRRLRETLAEVSEPAGRDDEHPGLVHHPNGEATYRRLLGAYGMPDATAEQVHATGREQQERLDAEWAEVGSGVFGVTDPVEVRQRVAAMEGPTSSDEVRRTAFALHASAEDAAPRLFRRTPAAPCEIRATEHGPLAFYTPPTEDGSRPGIAWFNVADPSVWGPQLAATVFHEGIPGHHFQLALGVEDDQLHEMHRQLFLPAFGEGWALYVERIADELGLYPDDVARLGMLASDAMRATRLVVDTGIHALGWTRQQAIDEMVSATGLGITECTAEVDRYIAYPGQATSYMTGRLEIERLRDDATDRLGDDFDLPAFHDVVLSHGMVSLDALDRVVTAWDGPSVT